MSNEITTLLDICDNANGHIQTGPFGSQLHQTDYSIIGIPVIMPKDIIDGYVSEATIARVSSDWVEKLSRHKVSEGDIIYSRRGDVGRCAYITDKEAGWLCGTGCLRVSVDQGLAYPRYVYYYLKQASIVGWVEKHAIGATMLNLNTTILGEVPMQLPSLPVQHRIADILSTYDDLIENNRKQIKLLEEAAQRLYKEWFVDLRFPGWETTPFVDGLPEGWTQSCLSEAIDFNPTVKLEKGAARRTVPMSALSTSSMEIDESQVTETQSSTGAKFSNGDTLLARITPCLENGKTAFVSLLDDGETAVGSTEFIVMRSKNLNPYMVYCIARSDDFRQIAINSMTGADGRQRVQTDKLELIAYKLPKRELVDTCAQIMSPMFDRIKVLDKQIIQAQQARDALLPKLMSDEMEV